MDSTPRWHETFEAALREAVDTIGGPKTVGHTLWPQKEPTAAARYLNQCLDPGRAEKLEATQIVAIMRAGFRSGCHAPMTFLADEVGYKAPEPRDVEAERLALQREFIQAQQHMAALIERMDEINGGLSQ